MPPIQIADFESTAARLSPQTIVIAGGDRAADVSLYGILRDKPYVKQCLLVGTESEMRAAAEELGLALSPDDVVGTASQEETAERILELARTDGADIIQKGNISTPILNRQLVKLRTRDTMSLATVFQADCIRDGATMIMTDPGISAMLNYSRMTGLIRNSVEVARAVLGIDPPRVALLAGNEKVMQALPSTVLANELAEAHWEDAIVYGPLSMDLAVDPGSVELKRETLPAESPLYTVAGRADILINPNLDAANIMYKMLMQLTAAGSARMACVTVGIKTPYVISSRSDPERSKIDSIALACIYANHLHEQEEGRVPQEALVNETTRHVLTVNPGSTSTKLALFENRQCLKNYEVPRPHKAGLKGEMMDREVDEYVAEIRNFLGEDAAKIDAIVGRGGFLNRENQHIEGGVYQVATVEDGDVRTEAEIIAAVRDHAEMDHASNLGIPIAARLAETLRVPAFSVDPVVVDELQPEARYSGYAPIERKSAGHVLSIRAAARKAAVLTGRPLDKSSFVIAHLGGGITVAAVRNGRIVDNTIALLGEGAFTPQRAGTLPQNELIDLCYEGEFSREELKNELTKHAGLISYLKEDRLPQIEERIAGGDEAADKALDAMVYQIAKDLGAMTIAVGGAIDAIVLTGGIARSDLVMSRIKKRVGHLAQVIVFRETMEMEAMADGALAVLAGRVKPHVYQLLK